MPLWNVRLQPTKEEWLEGVRLTGVCRPRGKISVVKSVILLAVGIFALTAYFGQREAASLFIGVASLVLLTVVWAEPPFREHMMAREAAKGNGVRLWVFSDGVSFGSDQPQKVDYPFPALRDYQSERILAWKLDEDQVVVVPKRQISEEQWKEITGKRV